MIYIYETAHLYHVENFLFFIINLIVFQLMMYIPLRKFFKERITLHFVLISSVFFFIYFLMFADFLERLFYGMIIVNGYLVIFGIVSVFTLFNFFVYGKDSRFQGFLFLEGLFMFCWFFCCQFLTFHLFERYHFGSFVSFFGMLLAGIPVFIKFYSLVEYRLMRHSSIRNVLGVLFLGIHLFLNSINIMLFTFRGPRMRIIISNEFIGKSLFDSFGQHVKLSFLDLDNQLSKVFFFGIIASAPIISIFQLVIKKQLDQELIQLQTKREEELKKYIQMIESINQETRQLQHDIGNVLSSLGMHVYQEKPDILALREYYKQVNQDFGLRRITKIPNGKLTHLKNPEILGLVLDKLMKAKEFDIHLNLEIDEAIQFPAKGLVPIVRILAILVDNALEESKKFTGSVVRLAFVAINEEQILTMIENHTYNEKFMEQYLSDTIKSDKGVGRGQGLKIMTKLVKENRQLHLDCKQNDQTVLFSFLVEGKR
ncbi:GHKL domain-containing protein [Candidatus Enterococcus murrayae]|uniref:GHKL domain-containing protein n=1 Tax=Candidatus Enterococcus murrayae TaxID=2815321 RepID=A0ABS3HMC9_9ENTE|nr:GHKL domain-containing protein [Enterococcus sp. MJM16]MBO0454610.1 GHKL domain-containing protein [Enterococcus sp. MJM16]